jgi:hypothetical protein
MKKIIVVVCVLSLGVAGAMPTEEELAKSEAGVAAIVADVEKREKEDLAKVADELVALENEVANDAERFLFRREAVLRYLKAAQCGLATEVLKRITSEDDADAVSAIEDYVHRKLTFKERKALKSADGYKDYAAFVKDVESAQKKKAAADSRLKELKAAHAKSPDDVRVRNQLATEYALRGKWSKAVPLFAKADGAIGAAAQVEAAKPDATGSDAASIGDAWWKVEGKGCFKALKSACRVHAAEWYRTAMTDAQLPNLVKIRIGGRIEEIEASGEAAPQEEAKSAAAKKTAASARPAALPTFKVKGGEVVKIALDAKGKVFLELTTCAPGKFQMDGGSGFSDRAHQVALTYPYLIGKTTLTFGQVKSVDRKTWKQRMDRVRTDDEKNFTDDTAFGGITDSEFADFLGKLNALAVKCRELRAYKGYEFRLATEAEWVCAYQAGSEEMKKGMGLREELLDTIAMPLTKKGERAFWLPDADRDVFHYADAEENPVRVCDDKNACHLVRKGQNRKDVRPVVKVDMKGRVTGGESGGYPIRLVFGPKTDLLNVYPKKP